MRYNINTMMEKKIIQDTSHIFPYGATKISFSRIHASDRVPCKIRTTMPFDDFPVDPSDYRTDEKQCPKDMVATGIILDGASEKSTLVCSPVYHEDQIDNQRCTQLRVAYKANRKPDWDNDFPYEAAGVCPAETMLTGVDYSYDSAYVNITCCGRKSIQQIISLHDSKVMYLVATMGLMAFLVAIVWVRRHSR